MNIEMSTIHLASAQRNGHSSTSRRDDGLLMHYSRRVRSREEDEAHIPSGDSTDGCDLIKSI